MPQEKSKPTLNLGPTPHPPAAYPLWARTFTFARRDDMPKKYKRLRVESVDYAHRLSKEDLEWLRAFESEYEGHGDQGIQSETQRLARRADLRKASQDIYKARERRGLDAADRAMADTSSCDILAGDEDTER